MTKIYQVDLPDAFEVKGKQFFSTLNKAHNFIVDKYNKIPVAITPYEKRSVSFNQTTLTTIVMYHSELIDLNDLDKIKGSDFFLDCSISEYDLD
tara:strand:+ start:133 stop:414 length:282 start_codon:yes stop_codon:yes gene_type:complete